MNQQQDLRNCSLVIGDNYHHLITIEFDHGQLSWEKNDNGLFDLEFDGKFRSEECTPVEAHEFMTFNAGKNNPVSTIDGKNTLHFKFCFPDKNPIIFHNVHHISEQNNQNLMSLIGQTIKG